MFKTEAHLHTKETSACSRLSAEEMVELYHKAGYQTICVSDHMHRNFLESHAGMTREEAVDQYLTGYHNAVKAAKKYGMNVILAAEYSIGYGNLEGHYLLYGIDRDFLVENANCTSFTLPMLRKVTQERGVFVIQAHPFRGAGIPTPGFMDGVEVYNPNPRHFGETDELRSTEIAALYGLYATAGSDAHREEDIAVTGIGSEYEVKTAEDYIELIKSRKISILRNHK